MNEVLQKVEARIRLGHILEAFTLLESLEISEINANLTGLKSQWNANEKVFFVDNVITISEYTINRNIIIKGLQIIINDVNEIYRDKKQPVEYKEFHPQITAHLIKDGYFQKVFKVENDKNSIILKLKASWFKNKIECNEEITREEENWFKYSTNWTFKTWLGSEKIEGEFQIRFSYWTSIIKKVRLTINGIEVFSSY